MAALALILGGWSAAVPASASPLDAAPTAVPTRSILPDIADLINTVYRLPDDLITCAVYSGGTVESCLVGRTVYYAEHISDIVQRLVEDLVEDPTHPV